MEDILKDPDAIAALASSSAVVGRVFPLHTENTPPSIVRLLVVVDGEADEILLHGAALDNLKIRRTE